MVLVDIGQEKQLYVNETLHNNIRMMRSLVYHDRDLILLVAGRTGTGKSVISMQICKMLDPTFDITRIVYKGQDLINIANTLPKYSAIMLDESRESLATDKAFDDRSKKILDYLNEVRHKNLYIVLLMPGFFDFRSALATERSHAFLRIYELENPNWNPDDKRSDPMMRGYGAFYDFEMKRTLYYMNKKMRSYKGVKPSFNFDFSNTYVVDELAYRALKDHTTGKYSTDLEPEGEILEYNVYKTRIKHYVLAHHVLRKLTEKFPDLSRQEAAEISGSTVHKISEILQAYVPHGKKAYKRIEKVEEEVS